MCLFVEAKLGRKKTGRGTEINCHFLMPEWASKDEEKSGFERVFTKYKRS